MNNIIRPGFGRGTATIEARELPENGRCTERCAMEGCLHVGVEWAGPLVSLAVGDTEGNRAWQLVSVSEARELAGQLLVMADRVAQVIEED